MGVEKSRRPIHAPTVQKVDTPCYQGEFSAAPNPTTLPGTLKKVELDASDRIATGGLSFNDTDSKLEIGKLKKQTFMVTFQFAFTADVAGEELDFYLSKNDVLIYYTRTVLSTEAANVTATAVVRGLVELEEGDNVGLLCSTDGTQVVVQPAIGGYAMAHAI